MRAVRLSLSFALIALVSSVAQAEEPAESPTPPPQPSPVPTAAPSLAAKVFNPDIAVIGDFLGAAGKNDSPFATPALELHEAEASLQAIVDPYARADFFLTFSNEEVGVEEGFITFTALPASFLLKAGKMRGAFGKVNAMHNHIMPWTDRPLVTQNLAGGEEGISDAGLSLSRLFPNSIVFLEAIGEVYRGESQIFRAPRRGDLTYVGRLRAYRDLGESANLDLGGSFAYGHNDVAAAAHAAGDDPSPFTTRLIGVDATFRYRPLRRALYRRFLARTELVWSRRHEENATPEAFGAYVSAEYQLARRWFLGARVDRSERAGDPTLVDKGGSALLTFQPSEFSQIRGQYRYTRYAQEGTAHEFLFQLQFAIGAHGAHTF